MSLKASRSGYEHRACERQDVYAHLSVCAEGRHLSVPDDPVDLYNRSLGQRSLSIPTAHHWKRPCTHAVLQTLVLTR